MFPLRYFLQTVGRYVLGILVVGFCVWAVYVTYNKITTRSPYWWMLLGEVVIGIVFATVYIWITSIYSLTQNTMIVSFLIASFRCVYVSGTRYRKSIARNPKTSARTGFFGFDFAILLYPIWRVLVLPTSEIKVPLRVTDVFTRSNQDKNHRVELGVDATIMLRLSEEVSEFVQALDLSRHGWDYAAHDEWDIEGTELMPGGERKKEQCHGPKLAHELCFTFEETVAEAVRTVASQMTWGGEDDINNARRIFELAVLLHLSQPESVFVQAGLLEARSIDKADVVASVKSGALLPHFGEAALALDFIVEKIRPANAALQEAIDAPMVAQLKAQAAVEEARGKKEAAALIGEGEGRRLKNIADLSEIPAGDVRALEALDHGNLTVITGGDKIVDVVAGLAGKPGSRIVPPDQK